MGFCGAAYERGAFLGVHKGIERGRGGGVWAEVYLAIYTVYILVAGGLEFDSLTWWSFI